MKEWWYKKREREDERMIPILKFHMISHVSFHVITYKKMKYVSLLDVENIICVFFYILFNPLLSEGSPLDE